MANGAIYDPIARLKILRLIHNFRENLFWNDVVNIESTFIVTYYAKLIEPILGSKKNIFVIQTHL